MRSASGKPAGGSGTKFVWDGVALLSQSFSNPGVRVQQPVELTTSASIDEMLEKSHGSPVLLYKHSISCPISGYAWYEVENFLSDGEEAPACYRVTVQFQPELSRDIAEMLDVIHHTPQIIILRDGIASYVASHWQIRKQALRRALLNAAPSAAQE